MAMGTASRRGGGQAEVGLTHLWGKFPTRSVSLRRPLLRPRPGPLRPAERHQPRLPGDHPQPPQQDRRNKTGKTQGPGDLGTPQADDPRVREVIQGHQQLGEPRAGPGDPPGGA